MVNITIPFFNNKFNLLSNTMTITLNEKEYNVKYGFKALMIYERIEGSAFNSNNLSSIITFFYCCVLADNAEITFDEFIDYLDNNPQKINEFGEYLQNVIEAKTLKK